MNYDSGFYNNYVIGTPCTFVRMCLYTELTYPYKSSDIKLPQNIIILS